MFSGLQCDNRNCHWEDQSIKFEEYPKPIDAKCPECGDVILTQEDYDFCQAVNAEKSFMKKAWMVLKGPKHWKTKVEVHVEDDNKTSSVYIDKINGNVDIRL